MCLLFKYFQLEIVGNILCISHRCAKNEVYRHRRIQSVCEGSFTCDLHMKSLVLDFALKERNIFSVLLVYFNDYYRCFLALNKVST